jgi:Protein of unknown function (DUF3175)
LEHLIRWPQRNDTSDRFNFLNVTEMGAKRQKHWSAAVTHDSNALDLQNGVFKLHDPHRIALSLKRSAERSPRRKGTPFQSAMMSRCLSVARSWRVCWVS